MSDHANGMRKEDEMTLNIFESKSYVQTTLSDVIDCKSPLDEYLSLIQENMNKIHALALQAREELGQVIELKKELAVLSASESAESIVTNRG